MIPDLTDKNVDLLATTFLDTNVLLRHPITLTTFIGYAFPTDDDHPEPWGKRAGQLRRAINSWIDKREDQVNKEVLSKREKLTSVWRDPLKVAAIRARRVILPDPRDKSGTKNFVQRMVGRVI